MKLYNITAHTHTHTLIHAHAHTDIYIVHHYQLLMKCYFSFKITNIRILSFLIKYNKMILLVIIFTKLYSIDSL